MKQSGLNRNFKRSPAMQTWRLAPHIDATYSGGGTIHQTEILAALQKISTVLHADDDWICGDTASGLLDTENKPMQEACALLDTRYPIKRAEVLVAVPVSLKEVAVRERRAAQ